MNYFASSRQIIVYKYISIIRVSRILLTRILFLIFLYSLEDNKFILHVNILKWSDVTKYLVSPITIDFE